MNGLAEVLVLVLGGAGLAVQVIEPLLHEAGHAIFAVVASVEAAIEAVTQQTRQPLRAEGGLPDLLLVDTEQMHDPGHREAITTLVHRLGVPAVYVARCEEDLARPWRGGDSEDIVARLDTHDLALAIELALCRRENARLHVRRSGIVAHELRTDESGHRREQEVLLLEHRWGQLLSSIPAVLYIGRDAGDFAITFMSENVRVLLGYHADELTADARFWLDRIHPDDVSRVLEWLARARGEETSVEEYRFRHRDGTYRWLLDTRRLIRDETQGSEDIVGSWMDITERKRTEDALRQSETRYKAIIEDQTELICRFRPEGVLTFVNDAYCRYFGKQPEELIGHSFVPLLPPEDQAIADSVFASLGPDNPVVSAEHRVIMPDDQIRWQSWTDRVILDEAGQIIEYQAVGSDITERKHAEEALRASEVRYASLFQMAAIPMWEEDISALKQDMAALRAGGVTDLRRYLEEHPERVFELLSRSRIVDMNNEGLRLFGAESVEEIARSFERVFLPVGLQSKRETLVALAEGKSHHESENHFRTLRGEDITVLFRVSFPSAARGLENMLLSCVDITARKRTEEKIRTLNAELGQRATALQVANAELESFSYSVSHDLRAPLRAIDGFSKAVVEDYADVVGERGRSYLHRVRQASQRMSQLIDDLLSLAHMARSPMHMVPCNMSDMAHALVRELRRAEPGRAVDVDIEPGMEVHADANLLRVALDNLLGNAWKFTARQPRPRIQMGRIARDGRTAYFVRDNGAGFDMAYVDKLFGAFQRLHGMHEFAGTGIGLATVRRIVRRHGGDIWAEGKEGEGATFTFTLS